MNLFQRGMSAMNTGSIASAAQTLCRSLRRRGITDERVLSAIASVPRDRFVPDRQRHAAWNDDALPIDCGQTISQPYIVALMTQGLALTGDERVLEIGTGSGYQAAILSRLCERVISIERIPELAAHARSTLSDCGCNNVEILLGDGTLGCPRRAPWDAIIVTAAAPSIPEPLIEQLRPALQERPGGRMIAPVGNLELQSLRILEVHVSGRSERELCGCRFVPLIGAAAWPET